MCTTVVFTVVFFFSTDATVKIIITGTKILENDPPKMNKITEVTLKWSWAKDKIILSQKKQDPDERNSKEAKSKNLNPMWAVLNLDIHVFTFCTL